MKATIIPAFVIALAFMGSNLRAQDIEQTPDFVHNFFALVDKKCPFLDVSDLDLNAKITAHLAVTSNRFSEALDRASARARTVNCSTDATFQGQQYYRSLLNNMRKSQ